jgi:hypothetical protein
LDYLGLRFWIGLWMCLMLLIIVALDLSALVRYITRFTEESFAMLIALIFIVEAFKKLAHITDHAAVDLHPYKDHDFNCQCWPKTFYDDFLNSTNADANSSFPLREFIPPASYLIYRLRIFIFCSNIQQQLHQRDTQ